MSREGSALRVMRLSAQLRRQRRCRRRRGRRGRRRSSDTSASCVELRQRMRPVGDEAERPCPPLAERALQRALPAEGSKRDPRDGHSPASGHASHRGIRARQTVAPRSKSACERRAGEGRAGAVEDPPHVRVDGQHVLAEGLVADRVGGVAADAGQLGEVGGPARRGDDACGPVQVKRAAVVPEPCQARIASAGEAAASDSTSATAPSTRAIAARRGRPASAAASPRRRGSRTGPEVPRQGRSRPWIRNHARSRSSTSGAYVAPADRSRFRRPLGDESAAGAAPGEPVRLPRPEIQPVGVSRDARRGPYGGRQRVHLRVRTRRDRAVRPHEPVDDAAGAPSREGAREAVAADPCSALAVLRRSSRLPARA